MLTTKQLYTFTFTPAVNPEKVRHHRWLNGIMKALLGERHQRNWLVVLDEQKKGRVITA